LVSINDAVSIAVVSFFGIDAVVVCCFGVVVARSFIEASFDFELIAYAISVCIEDAVSVAVISCFREDTVYKVCDEVWIDVVAGLGIDTSFDFELIADSVTIGINDALSLAVVSVFCVVAFGFIGCFGVVVACCLIGTSRDFKLIAYTVLVGISEALAIAVVSIFSEDARTVIVRGFSAVVAGRFIGASRDFELIADSIGIGVSEALAIAIVS
jgi:hypothetical protein